MNNALYISLNRTNEHVRHTTKRSWTSRALI